MKFLDSYRAKRKAKRKQKMLDSLSFGTDITGLGMSMEVKTAWARDTEQGTHLVEIIPPHYNEDGTTNMSNDELDDLIDEWHINYTGDQELNEFMAERAGWTLEDTNRWLATGSLPNA